MVGLGARASLLAALLAPQIQRRFAHPKAPGDLAPGAFARVAGSEHALAQVTGIRTGHRNTSIPDSGFFLEDNNAQKSSKSGQKPL
jgi:hypothetical protein